MDKILNTIKKFIPLKLFKLLQPAYHFFLSWLAAAVYGHPSEELVVIGITGTTGKTTSVYLIAKMLESAGYKTGFTSTAVFSDGNKEWLNDKKMTMVGRFFTQRILRQMVKNNCRFAIIETTSEGIRQYRHRFINYDLAIFTGLYPEHIESHGSFDNYKKAKGGLFRHLGHCQIKYIDDKIRVQKTSGLRKTDLRRVKKTIIVNLDDENAPYFLSFGAEKKIAYTEKEKISEANVEILKYGDIVVFGQGTDFSVLCDRIKLGLLGSFNVANAMNAISAGVAMEIPIKKIKIGLEKIKCIPGRFERIDAGQDFTVIVDYAYEPKAVAKLYETLKLIAHEKIIHVLGSTGGGRDVARRPLLGKLAGEKADYVIVTNEDPYDDDPNVIIDQVALGAERSGKKEGQSLFKISNRREALKKAFILAAAGDAVLITGKGSEQAICVANGEKVKWDDRMVAKEILLEKKKNNNV